MKIVDLIKMANGLVTSDHYADYCEQYEVPLQRAINQSGYDGVSEITDQIVLQVVRVNRFELIQTAYAEEEQR